jgi:hypothetical protein
MMCGAETTGSFVGAVVELVKGDAGGLGSGRDVVHWSVAEVPDVDGLGVGTGAEEGVGAMCVAGVVLLDVGDGARPECPPHPETRLTATANAARLLPAMRPD